MKVPAPAGKKVSCRSVLGILTTPAKKIFKSNYHAGLLAGIRRSSSSKNCRVKVLFYDRKKHKDIPAILAGHGLDGLMVLTWRWIHPDFAGVVERARENRLLVVNDPLPGLEVNVLHTHIPAGMKLAVSHLCRKGVRKIGLLHGPLEVPFRVRGRTVKLPFIDTRLKREGFVAALRGKKRPVRGEWIRPARANSEPEGYRVMRRWLLEKELPGAVICGNDDLAFGAIRALKEVGLRCPADMAVVGFDDNPRAKSFNPPLTTVRQPLARMGADAVNVLLKQAARPSGAPIRRRYAPELIVRKTA